MMLLPDIQPPPVTWCFKPGLPEQERGSKQQRETGERDAERWLVCVACGHRVTSDAERIEVAGAHEHTFMNPHAFAYHLGCFGQAGGAVPRGPATTQFTWFPGYAWRLAHCGGCGRHLGWLFQADAQRFYGLILNRLKESGDD